MLLAAVLSLAAVAERVGAQEAAPPAEPGSELTVYLTTFGPGTQVWEKFGHNAIWIRDRTTGTTISYNYGIFDEKQEAFVPRLLRGRMLYKMWVNDADYELAAYIQRDRSVWTQRLELTPAQKFALREFLEWNWLPENRDYLYDYFRDNCSTRVRDALDRALGGPIRNALAGRETGTTFRSHSLRLTAAVPLTYTGLLIGLGRPTDRAIDAWEETFVPMELMKHMRSINVPGRNGGLVPLVAEETTHYLSSTAPPPDTAPRRTLIFLVIGVALAGAILLLARRARIAPRARFALATVISFWGVLTGFLGLLLALLWLLTDHTAAYPNLNLLQLNPLGFLLAIAGPLALSARAGSRFHRSARLALPVALIVAVCATLGVLLQMFPGLRQGSAPIVAFAWPVHVAAVLSLYQRATGAPSTRGDNADRVALRNAA